MKNIRLGLYRIYMRFRRKFEAEIRAASLRRSMVSCGEGCSISNSANLRHSTIGNSVDVADLAVINECHLGSNISLQRSGEIIKCNIGSYTYISTNSRLIVTDVGMFCSIGPNVVCGCGEHPTGWLSTSPAFYSDLKQCNDSFVNSPHFDELKKVQIGSDCWVGANAVIRNGVSIGHGAIVAAGAVVTGDVPPYAIVAGVPAKLMRYRFDEVSIGVLLESEWWLQSADFLRTNSDIFRQGDVSRLVDRMTMAP